MDRRVFWKLKIAYWPHAVKAGVIPIESNVMAILNDEHESPSNRNHGLYTPFELDFSVAPSRKDFMDAVSQVPWMSTTFNTSGLIAIIAKNDWPMIDLMHKSSSVYLMNGDKQRVGELRVTKYEMFLNSTVVVPYITHDQKEKIVCGMKGENSAKAHDLLREKENWLKEQFVKLNLQDDEQGRILVMQQLLYDNGLRQTRPKRK